MGRLDMVDKSNMADTGEPSLAASSHSDYLLSPCSGAAGNVSGPHYAFPFTGPATGKLGRVRNFFKHQLLLQ